MPGIVLFGAGSPIIGDVEESCARLGLDVVAIVRNTSHPSLARAAEKVVEASRVDAGIYANTVSVPLFKPAHRQSAVAEVLSAGGTRFDPLFDPTAILPSDLVVAEGVYVNAGSILGARCRLERFVFINRGAVCGHDMIAAEFSSIGPGAVISGGVWIGACALVGAGAVILPGVKIGADSIVGAGSVVLADVPEGCTVAGNPARLLKSPAAELP